MYIDNIGNKELRSDILRRYARLSKTGVPKTCKLSRTHRRGREKVIFDNQKLAQLARNEFNVLRNTENLCEYVCTRSKDKHWHLAIKRPHNGTQ